MGFKPNYNQQRAERDRLKREKRAEKLKQQAERTALRKGLTGDKAEDEQANPPGKPSADGQS